MKRTVATITFILIFLFAFMAMGGAYLTFLHGFQQAAPSAASMTQSKVELGVSKDSASFKFSSAVPGLVIFAFGSLGLLLMAVKVPVRLVLGYTTTGGAGRDGLGMLTRNKVFSNEVAISLPVWWLLRHRRLAEAVSANA